MRVSEAFKIESRDASTRGGRFQILRMLGGETAARLASLEAAVAGGNRARNIGLRTYRHTASPVPESARSR